MLPLMWLAGCALVALASAALSQAEGPWLLGFAGLMAAQAALLAGRALRLPAAVGWAAALACIGAAALAYHGGDRLLYLGLAALVLAVADRFAVVAAGLSAFLLGDAAAGTRSPADPIARDFARVRREGSPLTVASIAVARARGSSHRLAEVARALLPCLRVTDAVVRVAADGVVVVLPGADER